MTKWAFTILLTCFLNGASESLFVAPSDTLNRLSKPIQKNKSYRLCPICHSNAEVIPVIYGYPTIEMARRSGRGEIIIGGCIPDKTRTHYCKKDKHYF